MARLLPFSWSSASTLPRRLRRAVLPLAAAALLAACGGGDRVEPFKPSRIYIYGDEYSYIAPPTDANKGLKYTVNVPVSPQAGSTPTTFACDSTANLLWVQRLVYYQYGKDIDACDVGYESDGASAQLNAQPGWKTADVLAALNARSFAKGELVVIFIGSNDVRDGSTDVVARGAELGQAVRRIADAGANVLIATVPVLGRNDDFESRRVAFNNALRGTSGLGNVDGRRVALLQADARIDNFFINSDNSSWNAEACASASTPLQCYTAYENNGVTPAVTVTGTGSATANVLWAFDAYLSPYGHELIGNTARSQVSDSWE